MVIRGKNLRIVDLVRDVRSRGLTVQPEGGTYEAAQWLGPPPHTTYVLRVVGDECQLRRRNGLCVPRSAGNRLDSGDIRLRLNRSIRDRTFATLVVGFFALATLLVADVLLAGAVAYTVAKRTREIPIGLALGATVDDVRRLVVRDALLAAICGMIGGIIASVSLPRAREPVVRVPPDGFSTWVLASTGLLGTVLIAAVAPATRAVRISPAIALRME